eukprot:6954329-Prymnesium_polylepis.2
MRAPVYRPRLCPPTPRSPAAFFVRGGARMGGAARVSRDAAVALCALRRRRRLLRHLRRPHPCGGDGAHADRHRKGERAAHTRRACRRPRHGIGKPSAPFANRESPPPVLLLVACSSRRRSLRSARCCASCSTCRATSTRSRTLVSPCPSRLSSRRRYTRAPTAARRAAARRRRCPAATPRRSRVGSCSSSADRASSCRAWRGMGSVGERVVGGAGRRGCGAGLHSVPLDEPSMDAADS